MKEYLVRVVLDLLTNRTTTIYGHTINIGRGVPQGDPLSPLLFILVLQPLSDAIAAYDGGGVTLPGDLLLKDLFYADDIGLLAESAAELQGLIQVCEEWALENGFTFSVEKTKVMILAGHIPTLLPTLILHDSPLEWVLEFRYLGFPLYASNKRRKKFIPLDLKSVYQVLAPMAGIVHHESLVCLPVIQRAQALVTMVEGKAMHNAQVADLDVKNINSYVNKSLKAITGLSDSTLLRCDLGVLPAELVVHRNALYYLWQLRHQAWFKASLPALAALEPLRRLTSMLLYYPSLRMDVLDSLDQTEWRKCVKLAVIERAESFYNTRDHQDRRLASLNPDEEYGFAYRGQRYTNNAYTTDMAQIALELRQHHLPMPRHLRPWDHHPCPLCSQPLSLNGHHLLQCHQLPPNLIEARASLIQRYSPDLSPIHFADRVLACHGAHLGKTDQDSSTDFLRSSLALGRKIARFVKSTLNARERLLSDRALAALFNPDSEEPPVTSLTVDGRLSSLGFLDDTDYSDGA